MEHLQQAYDGWSLWADGLLRRHPKVLKRRILLQLQDKTHVPAAALFLGGAALALILVVTLIGLHALALIVGFAYPSYTSLKALKADDRGAQTFFIKYWLFFCGYMLVDSTFSFLYSIPFYSVIKLWLITWAFHPETQGAAIVYKALRAVLLPTLGIEPALPEPPSKQAVAKVADTYSVQVWLAARGLEKPGDTDDFDTYCCLRVKPKSREGMWLKTSCNSSKPLENPDWRGEPQHFPDIPTLDDTVLEVVVKNKQAFRDVDLGLVRLPLRDAAPSYHSTLPLQSAVDEGTKAKGELEIELVVSKSPLPPRAPPGL